MEETGKNEEQLQKEMNDVDQSDSGSLIIGLLVLLLFVIALVSIIWTVKILLNHGPDGPLEKTVTVMGAVFFCLIIASIKG